MDYSLQTIANQAAGFYFLVKDNSQTASVPTVSRMRLIFINVPKGPVNSLVYVERGDTAGFKEIFGDINRADERNGNFSIRTCLWALENGPILVCNLRSFDDNLDKAGMIGLATSLKDANNPAQVVPYTELFNTERLWWNDPKQLLKQDAAGMFNMCNVGSQDLSIFVRKSTLKGYDVTFKEWYATLGREVPGYVNPSDYVSDSMVDVYIFKTNFSDPVNNMGNENYGYLFDANGLKDFVEQAGSTVSALEVLAGITDAQYIGKYSGSLVPGMIDMQGNSMQIQLDVNAVTSSTGLMVSFNEAEAEDLADYDAELGAENGYRGDYKRKFAIDLVGHSLVTIGNDSGIEFPENAKLEPFMSYNKTLAFGKYTVDFAKSLLTVDNVENADVVTMDVFVKPDSGNEANKFYNFDAVLLSVGDRVVGLDGNLKRVTSTDKVGDKTIIEGFGTSKFPLMPNGELFPTSADGSKYVYPAIPVTSGGILGDAPVGFGTVTVTRSAGSNTVRDTEEGDVRINRMNTNGIMFVRPAEFAGKVGQYITYQGPDTTLTDEADTSRTVNVAQYNVYEIIEVNENDVIVSETPIEPVYPANTDVQYDATTDAPIDQYTGKPVELNITDEKLAELKKKYGVEYSLVEVNVEDKVHLGNIADAIADPDNHVVVTMDDGTEIELVKVSATKVVPVFENNFRLQPIILPAYKVRKDQFCNGTAERQSSILDNMMLPNIVKGLKNSLDYRPRYVVDAFKTYIEPSYKMQFGQLCQELSEHSTVFCRAIINEAFIEDMYDSKNPYFRKDKKSPFSTEYVETGGNKKMPGTNSYEKSVDGARYCYYFGPGLTVNHYGQSIVAPPAGVVSKVFIDKYTEKFPYTIVANKTGMLSGSNVSGVEIDLDQDDRGPLERVGYNAIIRELGRGIMVYGNNTGQYKVKTSMSKIHVSELVAFIQEQMLAIMKDYIFEFNNYQNRLEIKKRADEVMNPILDNGGVLYFENKCDASNNTLEIIENDMGVLDTIIVPGRGMEKVVHRTYLERGANITGFSLE